ncbi:hypothetical protein EON63_17395 [archaeon]|nr:MAG: hypothetical protein EON63_17395 [archaeon]
MHNTCTHTHIQVGDVLNLLRSNTHHCYPIVDSDEAGVLQGTISRKCVCTLLKHKAYTPHAHIHTHTDVSNETYDDPHTHTQKPSSPSHRITPLINWGTLECIYPDFPDVGDVMVPMRDRECYMDLRPYIDASPYVLNEHASIQVSKSYTIQHTPYNIHHTPYTIYHIPYLAHLPHVSHVGSAASLCDH